jgi:ribosome-associated protein
MTASPPTTASTSPSATPPTSAPSHTADILAWARVAAQAADEKKGTDPVILQVGDLLSITEAFVIVSAPNNRLVLTIVEEVELQVKLSDGPTPLSIEGLSDASWVLIDFGSFVVHVFQQETREFYDLERLWKEAPRIAWTPHPVSASGPDPSQSPTE